MSGEDFSRTRRAKWEAKRIEFGSEWVGDPPLMEAQDECRDGANYVEAAFTRGEIDEDLAVTLIDLFERAYTISQAAYHRHRRQTAEKAGG